MKYAILALSVAGVVLSTLPAMAKLAANGLRTNGTSINSGTGTLTVQAVTLPDGTVIVLH